MSRALSSRCGKIPIRRKSNWASLGTRAQRQTPTGFSRAFRREALRSRLAASEDTGIRLHPNMAGYYRTQAADLRAALTEAGRHMQAAEIVRKLVDRIELSPVVRSGRKTLSVSLYGRLAGILAMATKAKAPLDESDAPVRGHKIG